MLEYLILAAAGSNDGGLVAGLAKTANEIGEKFGWSPQLFISQVITFFIVAFALKAFAYGPIVKMLDERKRRIAESMANADKIKGELENAKRTAQEIVDKANAQAAKMIQEAQQAAARLTEQETQKASAQARDIVAKASRDNEAELARMKAELKREIGRLVVDTTAKVAGKVLSPEDQRRLAEEANRQLAA